MSPVQAAAEITTRPPVLAPLAAYEESDAQKKQLAADFFNQLIGVYKGARNQTTFATPALEEFVHRVKFRQGSFGDDVTIGNAIREVYADIVRKYGVARVNPRDESYNEFYSVYEPSFPLEEERETKASLKRILKTPASDTGFVEAANMLKCPLTGKVLGGVQFAMDPENNTISYTYAFLDPAARKLKLSHLFVESIKKDFAAYKAEHGYVSKFPDTLVMLEKNDVSLMVFKDALFDTARLNPNRPPRKGDDLTKSAVDQNERDAAWASLGFKLVNARYIQSVLGHVAVVPSSDEKLCIDYLLNKKLSRAQKKKAEKILETANAGRGEPCLALVCGVISDKPDVNVAQLIAHQRTFQGISVMDDAENYAKDIYFKAMLQDLKRLGKTTTLVDIPPLTGARYSDAMKAFKNLLGTLTWKEIRDNPDRSVVKWLQIKDAEMKASNDNAQPSRAATTGLRVPSVRRELKA